MMTLSESLGQKCHPVSHAAPLKRNTPTPFTFLSLSPRQTGVVEKKKRMGSILSVPSRFSVFLPSCLLHESRGQACRLRARTKQTLPSRLSQSLVCVFFLKPRASTIPSLPCGLGVFLPSCLLHASRGQTWIPRASTNQSLPSRLSQSVVSVFLNPWTSKIPSVPCSFSVFLPSCLLHASRGHTYILRASTNQSLPCRLSQSVVSVFLNPWASKIPSVPCSSSVFLPSCLLRTSSQTNLDPSSKHEPVVTMSAESKCCVCFS